MDQLKKLYASFSRSQRVAIFSVIGAAVVALCLVRWYEATNFKPLYTSLAQEDAGAVIEKLKQSGVDYRLADNGSTVLVPASHVAESRLQMALDGLPKTGRIGFELFDRTNLGVTEFAEHINYQRALEGELERSVMSLAEVEQARVHVTFAKDSVFSEVRRPAKASVLLKLRPGSRLSSPNVVAISHLVAAAVEGLKPRSVSILDMSGNLLSRPRGKLGNDLGQAPEDLVQYQRLLEQGLVTKINETLEPLLGQDKFQARVSVECDYTSGEQSEESYDPAQTVMTNSQRTQETASSSGAGGIPGTASTLPRPRPEGAAGPGGTSRTTENITYQTSRTVRRTKIPQGTIKKISAAVLVDYATRWEGEGDEQERVVEPLPSNRMEAIEDLVAAAIGLDPSRGDQLIVQTLPFESTLRPKKPPVEAAPAVPQQNRPKTLEEVLKQQLQRLQEDPVLLTSTVVAGCLLLAVLLWIRGRSRRRRRRAEVEARHEALPAGGGSAQEGQSIEDGGQTQGVAAAGAGEARALPAPQPRPLVLDVQGIVQQDPELSAGIVQGWLREEVEA